MAKKLVTLIKIVKVSCSGCKYNSPGEHPALMWCDKIRMPLPSEKLKQCIYKTLK